AIRKENADLKAQLDSQHREDETFKQEYARMRQELEDAIALEQQARQLLATEQKTLERQVIQLQGERRAIIKSPKQPHLMVALQDTSGWVTIGADGTVSMADAVRLPARLSQPVAELARSGTVTPSRDARHALASLRDESTRGALRGGGGLSPTPLNPMFTAVRSASPALRWEGITGSSRFKVTVALPPDRENGRVVWESGEIGATEAAVPAGVLHRGQVYFWQVETRVDGRSRVSPPVGFWIIGETDLREVESAEQDYQSSALVLAGVYAKHGLYEDALAQAEKLYDKNPSNVAVKELIRNLRRQLNKQ
ncbi:MAG TPA: hypothetical protein VFV34_06275, partial [Blastocatellia bacterium]|nr:hypothetical protein [Blastocatellia bacterium]